MTSVNPEKTRKELMLKASEIHSTPHAKVTVVGLGAVGMAGTYGMMIQGVASELVLIEAEHMTDKLEGEVMDLQHGMTFCRNVNIVGGSDYSKTAGSKVCVVTAGLRQKEGQTRLELIQGNAQLFKKIIPELVKYSPDCTLIIVSNPVDVLTWLAWKISKLPWQRVIGTGTMLDSSRFRYYVSDKLGVSPNSVHGYIIGEHGDSSVPVWSGLNVGGTRIVEANPDIGTEKDDENWNLIHKDVVESAGTIIKKKGYTSWAIGTTISHLVHNILKNTHSVLPLSINVKGLYGIKEDMFLSNPCVIGENGIEQIFKLRLNAEEQSKLQKSADAIGEVMKGVKL
ncbi:DgyrCDS6724 [Dimorphilus gyrociliatus]|uniref:L-lactate dehydrogenase n=1 Tax=Dimorphilus gyrociliatus TaxID=2664684 RepID=A0A7I8VTQ5_9ANNE|nr:DgyrCDS6724 [Dimorphilus gyrociliatus]